jgi:hypothetical protein
LLALPPEAGDEEDGLEFAEPWFGALEEQLANSAAAPSRAMKDHSRNLLSFRMQ